MKTVSLELSKQLKEAGYPQESYFYWEKWVTEEEGYSLLHYISITEWNEDDKNRMFTSPTADEILDQLPISVKTNEIHFFIKLYKSGIYWIISYLQKDLTEVYKNLYQTSSESIADAAAKMWLYLKKNNLL